MDLVLSLEGKAHPIMCLRSEESCKDRRFITLGSRGGGGESDATNDTSSSGIFLNIPLCTFIEVEVIYSAAYNGILSL